MKARSKMRLESSVTIKGQITLPAALRKRFGLERGRKVMFVATDEGILVKPAELLDLTKKPEWKAALDESLAQAGSGKGDFFASDEEFMNFLKKESKKSRSRKK